ncbi:GDSL-type esterase/lipase family protein, partial [Acinetobacter baumannii]
MAQLAPMMQLRARFEDKCGHPLAGGSVFAFEVGTSTPKDTYADAEGTKQNTHPIKLDYRGEADIFLLSGRYRFVVYSCTGVKIYDVDNVGEWLGSVSADNVYDGDKTQHEINQEQADKNASLSQEIVNAVNVEKERALSAETVLNQSIQNEINRATEAEQALTQSVINETNRATSAEVALQNQVNALGGGTYGFNTYSAFDAVKSTIPANSLVNISEVNNTGTGSWGQGDNVWDGTNLTKSPYDPLQLAKDFSNANKAFKPQPVVEPTDFNTLVTYGFYYFFSGATWDSSPNKPPFNNQWAYMLAMPVSTDVVAQYVWALNTKKLAYRFRNASGVWSTWGVFSDDATLTAAIESSVNTDLDGTFDARAFNSITPNFETLTKNLFDKKAPLLLNRRIDQFGELEKHQKSVTTSLINVQGLSSMAVSGLTASAIAYRAYRFLDKDKKWISNDPILLNTTRKIIPVPANAVWFQLCLKDGIDTWDLNLDTIQIESGTAVTAYASYVRGYLKTLFGADFLLDPFQLRSLLDPAFENLSRNFFDKTAPLLMNRRITSSGVLEYHLNSVTTMPVYVKGLSSMAVSGLTASAIAYRAYRFLDKDKKWISNDPILLNTTSKIIPVPANAVWFQLCLKDGIDTWALNLDTIQFEAGSTVTAYTAYIRGNLKSLYSADIAGSLQSVSRAYGGKYLFFGDSITQTSRVDEGIFDETNLPFPNWPTYAKEQLKMSSYRNYAKSGASFRESGQTNPWQMMSHQVNTAITNAENPEIIIVAMGTNDGITSLGDYETAMGKATLNDLDRTLTLEAARWAFWTLKKNFPNAVCFYANPLQRASADSTELAPLIDGLSKMALRYGFTLIDQHHECGIIRDLET